jgi:lysozyme
MKINNAGLELIKDFEGLSLVPYPDPGTKAAPYTIGIGATFYQDGRKVTMADAPITEAQAIALLQFHLTKFEQSITQLVKVPLSSNQFSALVSFAYNCGTGNLQSSTLLKKLNASDYAGAADEFLKWDKANKIVMAGLTRRRKAERELFLKSETAKNSLLPDGPSEQEMNEILKNLENGI